MVRCLRRLCDPGNPVVSQWRTWRRTSCHFSLSPGAESRMCCLVKLVAGLVRIVATLLAVGRTGKAVNSAKNIAAIRDQIVKDLGMDHIPDVKHVILIEGNEDELLKGRRVYQGCLVKVIEVYISMYNYFKDRYISFQQKNMVT